MLNQGENENHCKIDSKFLNQYNNNWTILNPEESILVLFTIKINVNSKIVVLILHTTYNRNNMGQKCEDNCGLWVLNEILKKIYPENLKKIVGAVWELPAK